MGFWQITIGDIIGYILILSGLAITISIQLKISSHHNTNSSVGGDQVGRDKKC